MTTLADSPHEIAGVSKNKSGSSSKRVTAETMATRQRDISVSEFFAKNRHLLGFDNPRKALLTTVKEAVDNSLDACEEAGILPDITVVIEDLQPDRGREAKQSRYRITVVDNGPGIVKKQVENVFGRLLYGSKFHRLKMSRGQQGIGISAAGMYGLITTGKPMLIQTRPSAHKPAHHIELAMNTKTNRAEVTVDEETEDFPLERLRDLTSGTRELSSKGEFLSPKDYPTGTSVSVELEGRYQKGRGSVDEFLELTAIANPHARITFVPPAKESAEEVEEALEFKRGKKGKDAGVPPVVAAGVAVDSAPAPVTTETSGVLVFPRAVNELPPETKEIMPHPKGIELGILLQMLKEAEQDSPGITLYTFLQDKFSRVSPQSAGEFCKAIGLTSRSKVADVESPAAEKLFKVLQDSKLPPPPTDCLAPIGVQQLLKGMFKGVRAEFYAASSRQPEVYRGRPFLIEAAIAFGGELGSDAASEEGGGSGDPARVIRFANRVPLLFQQSACSSFRAVGETNWRNYDLQQPRGGVPTGPIVIMIHMASVWVPFTSESKEAIADYDEIRKEMKLALMECGRKLGAYLRKRLKMKREAARRDVFERYIGEITQAINAINGADAKQVYDALLNQARKRTAVADLQLDDEGKKVKEEDPADQEGVIIVEAAPETVGPAAGGKGKSGEKSGGKADPFVQSKREAAMLKVAAMDEDAPKLIDVDGPKRSSVKGKPAKPAAKKPVKPEAKAPERKSEDRKPAEAKPAAADRKPKPKMRLVNGKLVVVDEGPKLF
ncbi:MAG: DNA topoisomerase VI subunit B [Phycisphaerales bacterium]|nr:DNA topoisomerase VI subunit B [Phycisphaerales bacterium]